MSDAICGANCAGCSFREGCAGCAATCGRPFGGACVAADTSFILVCSYSVDGSEPELILFQRR